MSVEEVCNTEVVRLTGMFLQNIANSPSKTFTITLDETEYTLKVLKNRRKGS